MRDFLTSTSEPIGHSGVGEDGHGRESVPRSVFALGPPHLNLVRLLALQAVRTHLLGQPQQTLGIGVKRSNRPVQINQPKR